MIVDHPSYYYNDPKNFLGYTDAQVVKCDFCSRMAIGTGRNAGDAAEAALREGFVLVRGARLSDPKKWCCGCVVQQVMEK